MGIAIGLSVGAVLLGAALFVWIYVSLTRADASESPAALVNANQLNCRLAPSPNAGVVTMAKRGETVQVVEQEGSWRRVQLRGETCWVSGEFLQPGL